MPLSRQGKYRPFMCNRRENAARLKSLLDYIRPMAKGDNGSLSNAPPLFELMRLFAQEIMLSRAAHLLTTDDQRMNMRTIDGLFMEKPSSGASCQQKERYNEVLRALYAKPLTWEFEIDLAKDPVISPIWNRDRLKDTISRISSPDNPWKGDELNHCFELWMPLRLCVVTNGFHSLFAGCAKGVGKISTNGNTRTAYDISAVYPLIVFDGNYYRWRKDNAVVAKSPCFSFGCIFELGRFLVF